MGFSSASAVRTAFVETKEKELILMFAREDYQCHCNNPTFSAAQAAAGAAEGNVPHPTPPRPAPTLSSEDEHNGTHPTHNYLPPVLHFLPACHLCIYFSKHLPD